MKAEDIAELANNVKTLKEHNDIITWFENTGELNRDEALAKYENFNYKHPDFLAHHVGVSVMQSQLVPLRETDNICIVENMKCQHDWLYKKSAFKFSEGTLKEFIRLLQNNF